MPQLIFTECPHCRYKNRFDLLELKQVQEVYRGVGPSPQTREIVVRCQHCHRPFKVFVPAEEKAP